MDIKVCNASLSVTIGGHFYMDQSYCPSALCINTATNEKEATQMIITLKNPNGSMCVDTDKVFDRCVNGDSLYVRIFNKGERIKLIEFLESKGFWCIENSANCRKNTVE